MKRRFCSAFSILERIDVGETATTARTRPRAASFSILERIDVGETTHRSSETGQTAQLSVSSNGSTWVKLNACNDIQDAEKPFSILERIDVGETYCRHYGRHLALVFQYPRTDRRG